MRGDPGHLRLSIVRWCGLGWLVVMALSAAVLFAMQELGVFEPPRPGLEVSEWWSLQSDAIQIVFIVCTAFSTTMPAMTVFALISSWGLLPERFRVWFWRIFDGLLLVACVYVTWDLPVTVNEERTNLPQAGARLAVTVLFATRVIIRLLPPFLKLIERARFELLVGARQLRARKSGFLTAMGVLSVLAVALASCSQTVTLSIMGGFRDDLKRKILGNNAHAVVDREHGTFGNWSAALSQVEATRGVVAASPFVAGEVMVTSVSNLGGAVLRGIDPSQIALVTDLHKNMRHGRLEYLEHPEQLLRLPPEAHTGVPTILGPSSSWRAREGPTPSPRSSPLRDAAEALGPPSRASPIDLPTPSRRSGPPPSTPSRQVLPGIIVGQELARTLRLYVGDEVNVVSPIGDLGPLGPMPKSRPFRVAGIFYSGMYEYDMKYTYVTLETAQRFLNVGDQISGIEIRVADADRAPETAAAVRRRLGRDDLRVRDWQELNRNLFGALALEKLAMFIALGIGILVAGFCIFATLTLMVQEKGKEVAVLMSMGATAKKIVAIFLVEGLLIGLLGAGLGLGLGFVTCFAFEHFGLEMNPEVYYIDRLPVHMDSLEFSLIALVAISITVAVAIVPASIASRMRPMDALRFS